METGTEIVWSMCVSEASEAGAFPWEPALCVFICASKDHRKNGRVSRILYLFLFLKSCSV